MSKQSATKKTPSASKPTPSRQDCLDLLLDWASMAKDAGLDVVQLYNEERTRFTVRVGGVQITADGGLEEVPDVVAN